MNDGEGGPTFASAVAGGVLAAGLVALAVLVIFHLSWSLR